MASKRGDSAVVVTAAILEALTHIRSSNTAESIEHAQTALATVRSQQLDETVRQLPQLITIMHLVDVFCSLQVFNSTQAIQKMQAMHAMMDPAVNDNHWKNDGSFAVPVTQAGNFQNKLGPGGIVYKDERGREVLAFTWMPREDIYALAYLLSGAVVSHRNSWGGQKAEKYFREGLRMTQRML